LKILKDCESRFGHSIEYVQSIAGAYMKLKNSAMALQYDEKALELAKEQNVNQWKINIIKAKLLLFRV